VSRLILRRGLVGRAGLGLRAAGDAYKAVPPPACKPPVRQARPIVLPSMIGAPVKEIRRRIQKVLVFFVVDDSGSLYGVWGDPGGVRYAAALSLLGLMERSAGKKAGRAAVIHWGTTAPAELALVPVEVKRGRRALRQALTIPPTLGGTNLAAALDRAHAMTPELLEAEQVVYYVLSDGIEEVTAAIHAAVGALPAGSGHMVLVDRSGGCDPAMEAAWQAVAFGSFTRLKTFDTREMSLQLAEIFASSMGLSMAEQPDPKSKEASK